MLELIFALETEEKRQQVGDLYRKHEKKLYQFVYHHLQRYRECRAGNADEFRYDIEEIIQNAFVKIITHYDIVKWELGEDCVKSYFYAIVTNETVNFLKKKKENISLERLPEGALSESDFSEELCARFEYGDLLFAVTALEDIYSIPIRLKYVESLSAKEIAKLLGIRTSTVYTRIRRGKELLVKMLQEKKKDKGEGDRHGECV